MHKAEDQTSKILRVLSDPTRRRILRIIAFNEHNAGELESMCKLAQPTISHHINQLRTLKVIRTRRAGTYRYYRAETRRIKASLNKVAKELPR